VHDYVIIGAGTAGCVLAARLTEDPSVSVLLLEAGPADRAREIGVPIAFSKLFKSEYDWDYTTEPQKQLNERECYWPRGRVLGGSSSINAMIYIRGNRADYDAWRDAGNDGWGFDDLLRFFRRSENNSRGESAWHGVGGPVDVQDLRYRSRITDASVTAALERGHRFNDDFNAARQLGMGFWQVTQRRGRRVSAASAFLRPATGRPNLTVHTNTSATRLVVERGRVVGVEAVTGGRRDRYGAEREVLVCAGAVNTPHLLLLSGIGPADELRSLGIDVVADSPNVGRNLQDHVAIGASWFTDSGRSYDTAETPWNTARYLLGRRGPYTSNVAEGGGFHATDGGDLPDLQLLFGPTGYLRHGLEAAPGPCFSLGAYLLTPESRGTVRLRSPHPGDKPLIDPGYLDEPSDRQRLLDGLRECLAIGEASALSRYRTGRFLPARDDENSLVEHIQEWAETIYHPVGTAAMGPAPTDVVDPALRVRGVDGLRVADASVMPTVPRGNTNTPTMVIAERSVELIRTDPA
jgi:choline dehydrogenase